RSRLSGVPGGGSISVDTGSLSGLPPSVRQLVTEAFVRSSHVVFLAAAGVAVLAVMLALVLREIPLRRELDVPGST
ncbi:MAG: hypothetical protein ACRDRL_24775, partial [Sciscionella sp.]